MRRHWHTPRVSTRTADLSDADDDRLRPCVLPWRSFGAHSSFQGPASTVRCRDDNGLVRAAVQEPGLGRVLVVDGGGSLATALVGDNLAGIAAANGWAGVVVVGAVRDVVALATTPIGVLALGVVPRRGTGGGLGERDVAVAAGGVVVRPGAQVVADEDGVLVDVLHPDISM